MHLFIFGLLGLIAGREAMMMILEYRLNKRLRL